MSDHKDTTHDRHNDVSVDTYDAHIIPAETAARKEREGDGFKQIPHQAEDDDLDTSAGYTVDKEGLVNNFAIEPEMYVNEPGDLREKKEQLDRERAEDLAEVRHDDETGKLTEDGDKRGKGPGMI
jgi:hypothetical protein